MTTHTPEPWKAEGAEVVSAKTRAHVAHVKLALDIPEQHAANLRLITAAPDLLKAIQGMVDDYEHLAFPEDDKEVARKRRRILDAARKAIAKATGARRKQ
jgi:hypothetical protein